VLDKSLANLDNTPVLVLAGWIYKHVVDSHVQQFVGFSTLAFVVSDFALFNEKVIDEFLEDGCVLP